MKIRNFTVAALAVLAMAFSSWAFAEEDEGESDTGATDSGSGEGSAAATSVVPDLPNYVLRLTQQPPTRTRVNVWCSAGPVWVFEWTPEQLSSLTRLVPLSCAIADIQLSVSSEPSIVSTGGTARANLAWVLIGEPTSETTTRSWQACANNSLGITQADLETEIEAIPCPDGATAQITIDGPPAAIGLLPNAIQGSESISSLPSSSGRSFGFGLAGSALLEDVLIAASEVAIDRVERIALQGLRSRINDRLRCGKGGPAHLCLSLASADLEQWETLATDVLEAAKKDVIDFLMPESVGDGDVEVFSRALREAVIQLSQGESAANVVDSILQGAIARTGLASVQSLARAVMICAQSEGCFATPSLAQLQAASGNDAARASDALTIIEAIRSMRAGVAPMQNALSVIGTLANEVPDLQTVEYRSVLDALGGDTTSIASTICSRVRYKGVTAGGRLAGQELCNYTLTALIRAAEAAEEFDPNETPTAAEREARQARIAASIDHLASLSADRGNRYNEWLVAVDMSLGAGVADSIEGDADADIAPGAALGFGFDSPSLAGRRSGKFGLWVRARFRMFDTTTIVTSAIAEEQTEGSGDNAAADTTADQEVVASTIRWQDVFVPGATVGIGLGTRRMPVAIEAGVIGERYIKGERSILRPAFFVGASLNIPLFDLR
jgi:hypothetical protein